MADEPRAVLAGHDILSRGGSAADAATAMYFNLAVTLPSRAGLGGGGVCLAFSAATGRTEALDFTAVAPSGITSASDRPSAIPANPRGFFALHARLGRLQWREVIAPAEKLARFGHPVSRAFARDLTAVGPALMSDPQARAVYGGPSGQVAREGQTIEQIDLAATLGLIRARGVGPFYTGPYARNLVNQVNGVGGSLNAEDLRGYIPQWRDTVRIDFGFDVAHFAPPPASSSTQAAMMFAAMLEDGGFDNGNGGEQAHMLAELGLRAFADRERWLNGAGQATLPSTAIATPERVDAMVQGYREEMRTAVPNLFARPTNRNESSAATSFVAADRDGNAVACAVTMNALFGTGRVAPGSGMLLAAAPTTNGRGPMELAPMLVTNENTNEFIFAAAATGGVTAPSALASVAARTLLNGESLESAVTQPRVHLSGDPDVTYVEPQMDVEAQRHLASTGHRLAATPTIGTVNALHCPEGLVENPDICQMQSDPRALGLAAGSMQ